MHCPLYYDIGKLGDNNCIFCDALLFNKENSQICCRNGRVKLPPLSEHPELLKNLLYGIGKDAKHFVTNMSKYNTLLSFASIQFGRQPSPEGGALAILANGEFHRQISSMFAGKNQFPSYSQLWILDPETAKQQRIDNQIYTKGPKLKENLLDSLAKMHNDNHAAARALKQAKTQWDELNKNLDPNNRDQIRFFRLTLLNEKQAPLAIQDKNIHPNQIMQPSTGQEMFSVWASTDEMPPVMKGIWVEDHEGHLHEIPPYSPWTDCLCYSLIFRNPDDGWKRGIPYLKKGKQYDFLDEDIENHDLDQEFDTESVTSNESTDSFLDAGSKTFVSIRDFYRYRLAIRPNDIKTYHPILSCGDGLGQKFVLDIAARVDQQRAEYLRKNVNIRSTTAPDLLKYMIKLYNNQNARKNNIPKNVDDIGKVVLFNSKDPGKRAYWQRMYEDCTTVMARVYNPRYARLFITFTNNRKWPEFSETIYRNGQAFTDRFDMWMRIWKIKVDEFHRDLDEKHIFGNVLAYGESTEYQNRGGAHIHRVMQSDILAIPEVIENYIWAHIPVLPDADDDSDIARMFRDIRELISLQLHTCGENFCGGPGDHGRCRKRFPEPFSNVTILHPDRPAQYYRPSPEDGGSKLTFRRGKQIKEYDNRWIVPYNPYVLLKYKVHHNILFAYGSKANIKYAMSYPFKGPGFAYLECKEVAGKIDVDEPAQYAKMNFRAATEAYGTRIQTVHYARLSHHVVPLEVHLPDKQKIYFKVGKAKEAADKAADNKLPETQLTAYWKQWKNDPNFKNLLFEKVPEKYKWDDNLKIWVAYQYKLKKRPSVGRLKPVAPNQQQRFALYLLTKHYPGNPEHLLQESQDFVEAAIKRGLLESDEIWANTLREASFKRWPREMRWLFVTILVYGNPENALALWDEFKDQMFDKNWPIQTREQMALYLIERMLNNFGMDCIQFNLPQSNIKISNEEKDIEEFFFPDEEDSPGLNADNDLKINTAIKLTKSQKEVYDAVSNALMTEPQKKEVPRNFFVYGEGGTGKTSLFKQMIYNMRQKPLCIKVIVCASTGIAALLLPSGCTAHSIFRLGYKVSLDQPPSIPLESFFAKRIREASLIIIDEITMLHNTIITLIDRICKQLAPQSCKDIRYGGKVVIFSGDFKQSLPVVPHEGLLAQVAACFQLHEFYNQFTKMQLRENCRVKPEEQEFLKLLREIGTGAQGDYFWIPPEYIVQSRKELIDFVYPKFEELIKNPQRLLKHLIVAPYNVTVDEINALLMKRLPGAERSYMATLKPLDERPLDVDAIEFETAALYERRDSGMPPHELKIKVGCVVVLLQNMNQRQGLVNGTRLIVREMHDNFIVGEAITGMNSSVPTRFLIPRTRNIYEDQRPNGIKYESLQFPLRPAFCMTITKSQGQTAEYEGLDLTQDVFAHGQLYTAWSRVTSGKCFRVFAPYREKDKRGYTRVQNIVAKQLNLA